MMNKKIKIITTGGTIACHEGGNGFRPDVEGDNLINRLLSKGFPEAEDIRKAADKGEIRFDFCSLMCIDSSDMRIRDQVKIAEEVSRSLDDYDGIIITHGTDTMAYTAAALSVMLRNVPVPVILTGSQLSVDEEGTDASVNFCDSVRVVMKEIRGIYICFGGYLIDGRYATKVDSDDPNAFVSTDRAYIYNINDLELLITRHELLMENETKEEFSFKPLAEKEILLIKMHPAFSGKVLRNMLGSGCEAAVIELYGKGGLPAGDEEFLSVIEDYITKGMRVFVISQCIYRDTDLTRYEVGRKLLAKGVEVIRNYSTEYAIMYAVSSVE